MVVLIPLEFVPATELHYENLYTTLNADWRFARRFGSGQSLDQYCASLSTVMLHVVLVRADQICGQLFCYSMNTIDHYAYVALDLQEHGYFPKEPVVDYVSTALVRLGVRKLYRHSVAPSGTTDRIDICGADMLEYGDDVEAVLPEHEIWDGRPYDLVVSAFYGSQA